MTREEAISFLQVDKQYQDIKDYREALDIAIKALEQEPKTGKWTNEKWHGLDLIGVTCSNCHVVESRFSKYCPNCGAKMAETEEDKELIVNKDVYDTLTEEQKKFVDIGLSYFNNRKHRRKINSER